MYLPTSHFGKDAQMHLPNHGCVFCRRMICSRRLSVVFHCSDS